MTENQKISNSNENYQENENTKNKQKKDVAVTIYRIFTVVCLIAIILLIIFKPCNCNCRCVKSSDSNTYFDTTVDDAVTDPDSNSSEDIVNDLNKQVEDGMITISMNTEPVFDNGSSKGNLLIENDKSNKHPQVVQIYRKDTNEIIYTSSMIPIGKSVNEDTLDVKLSKGDYECTAYFNAVDEKTGEKLGTAGADITIHIQN